MIVFGAVQDSGNVALTATAIGAAFNPESDTWRQLPASNLSPQASTAAWDGHELIAWDYLNHSAAYNRQAGKWWKLPHVPLPPAECVPQSVSVEWFVVGDYCGATVVYNPADRAWHDVSRNRFAGWGFTLAPANRVVLLLGGDAETKEKAMFAYRPPKSFKP
jgi:hypothetical protein